MKLSIHNRRSHQSARGAAEIGLAVAIAALVIGALLGTALAPTTLSTSDGLTWLGDAQRGEAVQVNPATGQQETRLKVAPASHDLSLAQRDGLLVVTDATSGTVTVIDVGTLITGGRWFGNGDGAIEVLLNAKQLYVVDRALGAIQRLDPVNARRIGPLWTAGGLIVDAALDREATVWALRADGRLFSLVWSSDPAGLVEKAAPLQVAGAGVRSRLVPHERGVTVVAPEVGLAIRVGTGDDSVVEVGALPGQVYPAAEAPSDLVPVSVVDSAVVLLVHRGRVISVDMARLGCRQPREPVVYRERVYVACPDAGKVVVLSRDGEHHPPDIDIPVGEPKLVIDDGKLFIHVAGGTTGLVVSADGTVSSTETHDEDLPINDPDHRPPVTVPATKPPRQEPTQAPNPRSSTAGPSTPKTAGAPTSVTISSLLEFGYTLRAEASWKSPADNGNPITGFALVLSTDRGYSRSFDLTALRSGSVEIPCNSRCHGMHVFADVRATNSAGQGPVGKGNYTHNAPAQAPRTGDTVVTGVQMSEAFGTTFSVSVQLDPPFAWRTYEGACTLHYAGGASGSRPMSCWATTIFFSLTGAAGNYRFWAQAATVKSSEVSAFAYREPRDPPPCEGCHKP